MSVLYKWFDHVTLLLPPGVTMLIRWGAIALWFGFAVYLAINFWDSGYQSALRRGKTTPLVQIKEEVARKRNVQQAPHIVIPDLEDLTPVGVKSEDDGIFMPNPLNDNLLENASDTTQATVKPLATSPSNVTARANPSQPQSVYLSEPNQITPLHDSVATPKTNIMQTLNSKQPQASSNAVPDLLPLPTP